MQDDDVVINRLTSETRVVSGTTVGSLQIEAAYSVGSHGNLPDRVPPLVFTASATTQAFY